MEIRQSVTQLNESDKKQSWDKFQSQYGAKLTPQRQAKKTLDKDDFLKIMITQMQHQDPTEPFAADKLAQEIAQIASVEQLGNVNKALDALVKRNDPIERLSMTHLIGKTVTIDPNRFSHEAGYQSNIPFQLSEDAESVRLTVLSSKGELVLNKDIGSQKAGQGSYLWNGIKDNTLPAESDVYMINIEAVTKEGKVIPLSASQKTKIMGVSFTGAEPSFIVGDSKNYSRVPMRNVIQVDDTPLLENNAKTTPTNVIMQNNNANPFQQAAQNAAPQQPKNEITKAPIENATIEKGFPNGLSPSFEGKENI